MDTPRKPQASDEEDVPAPPAHAPSPEFGARSPFRPVSRRRRRAQVPEPPAAVDRPSTTTVFDASPTTIAAAMAKAGASSGEPSLAWRPGDDSDVEIEIGDDGEDSEDSEDGEIGENGPASPR